MTDEVAPLSSDDSKPIQSEEWRALFAPFSQARRVLAAVSGGPDSTALMHGLAAWGQENRQIAINVASVDHALRPRSADEARAVVEAAARLGLPATILTWTGPKPERGIQEAAREIRYRLLLAHAREIGADHLATAHTLDDQAETILIRLSRGSGLAGLAGMQPWRERGGLIHARPLLGVPKARLVATCRAWGWAYAEDPSNADPRFARVRWRGLMPALAQEGLDARRLARLGERLGRAEEALGAKAREALARARLPGQAFAWDVSGFLAEPFEIALRMLGMALDVAGGDVGPEPRLERLETCLVAVREAAGRGCALRRTLAAHLVSLDRKGRLVISPERPRRRGSSLPHEGATEPIRLSGPFSPHSEVQALQVLDSHADGSQDGFSHVDAAGAPHSLGKGSGDT